MQASHANISCRFAPANETGCRKYFQALYCKQCLSVEPVENIMRSLTKHVHVSSHFGLASLYTVRDSPLGPGDTPGKDRSAICVYVLSVPGQHNQEGARLADLLHSSVVLQCSLTCRHPSHTAVCLQQELSDQKLRPARGMAL